MQFWLRNVTKTTLAFYVITEQ